MNVEVSNPSAIRSICRLDDPTKQLRKWNFSREKAVKGNEMSELGSIAMMLRKLWGGIF